MKNRQFLRLQNSHLVLEKDFTELTDIGLKDRKEKNWKKRQGNYLIS